MGYGRISHQTMIKLLPKRPILVQPLAVAGVLTVPPGGSVRRPAAAPVKLQKN